MNPILRFQMGSFTTPIVTLPDPDMCAVTRRDGGAEPDMASVARKAGTADPTAAYVRRRDE